MPKTSLLLIEDEEAIRDMLRFSLSAADFHITEAENTIQATRLLADRIPDLILLDWMLPGKSGIDFLKWLRQQDLYNNIPIIMLTARAEEEHKIRGLMTGADDYITKPFSPEELSARIKTVLRRGPLISLDNEIKIGALTLNVEQQLTKIGNELLELSPIEYKLLYFFAKNPNKIFSRDQLITHVWGGNVYIDGRTIDVQIRRLRKKLMPFNYDKRIKTIRSSGYLFEN